MAYAKRIRELAPLHDPRHVEAFMRVDHSTLDHLSPSRFAHEVVIASRCVDEAGRVQSELLAQTYGL